MRNVTTYRICAAVCAAMVLVGGLRNEIATVVLAGAGALYCLRWARIEREREEVLAAIERTGSAVRDLSTSFAGLAEPMRSAAEAFRSFGEAMSHVRIVPADETVGPPE